MIYYIAYHPRRFVVSLSCVKFDSKSLVRLVASRYFQCEHAVPKFRQFLQIKIEHLKHTVEDTKASMSASKHSSLVKGSLLVQLKAMDLLQATQ